MDYDPISVALKFGFLAVLYLFLLVIARSAMKDLRADRFSGPRRDWLPRCAGLRRGAARRPKPGWSPSAAAASKPTSAST